MKFRNLTIKRKLTLIIMLVSILSLLLACAAFIVYQVFVFRRTMVNDISTLSEIIANNSQAALAFEVQSDAEEILAALRAKKSIVFAAIFNRDGKLFAKYVRGDGDKDISPPEPEKDGYRFGGGYLKLFHPIVLDNEVIGTVYLQSDLHEMYFLIKRNALVAGIIILTASLVAYLFSAKLQTVISGPIHYLSETAKAVSENKDYAVRARKLSDDEVGVLIDSFNEMLNQIQYRDVELTAAKEKAENAALESRQLAEETKRVNLELGREIAERKRAEKEILKLYEELEKRVQERTAELAAANRELEAFAYSVSHDLRAPLRSIDGFSLALLEDYGNKIDDEGKDFLRRVRAASEHMAQLISDLLKLSRVTRSEMRREEVDLSAIARAIAAELEREQPRRNVEFIITPQLSANGDPHLLEAALENLLGNAWKFTAGRDKTRIEFGVRLNSESGDMGPGGEPVYYIRDNGAGFDMNYVDKLFGAFQRLHSVNEFPGTGIGLATVQRIIHRHGGRIWAHGVVDQGATFYFTI